MKIVYIRIILGACASRNAHLACPCLYLIMLYITILVQSLEKLREHLKFKVFKKNLGSYDHLCLALNTAVASLMNLKAYVASKCESFDIWEVWQRAVWFSRICADGNSTQTP